MISSQVAKRQLQQKLAANDTSASMISGAYENSPDKKQSGSIITKGRMANRSA